MEQLRVASFNIRHGEQTEGVVNNGVLAVSCAALNADLLALQEVDRDAKRSGKVDQARAVAGAMGGIAVFGKAERQGWFGSYGNALISKTPVYSARTFRLPRTTRRGKRVAIVAEVVGPGGVMTVVNTHLSVVPRENEAQLAEVLRLLTRRPKPWLLMGDLNRRQETVVDLFATAGLDMVPIPSTFPAKEPTATIDYIATAGLGLQDIEVKATPVSDHLALLATVTPK